MIGGISRHLLDLNLHLVGLTLKNWRVFSDKGGQSVFAVQLAHKRTGIALTVDLLSIDSEVHLGQLALGTAHILLNKLIQHLPQVLLGKLSIDDVIGVILASSLLEGGLRGLLKAEPFEEVLLVGAQVLGHVTQIDDVGLDSVSFALDLQLHLGHLVAELGVDHCRRDVQH